MSNPHASALFVGQSHGTPSLHVGTTPGTDGELGAFRPRRVVNQTIGKLTNHSIPRWSLVRRFQRGYERYVQKGQFVFEQCRDPPSFDRSRLVTLFNLPTLNFMLAKLSIFWAREGVRKTAVEIASEFVPHGVVLSNNGESAAGSSRRAGNETMINATVRGEADTFNIWGPDVHDGDRLYFVYKPIVVNATEPETLQYALDFGGTVQSLADAATNASVERVWQVVPYVCKVGHETTPPETFLCDGRWTSDGVSGTERTEMGFARYVGRVQHARRLGIDGRHSVLVARRVNAMVNRTQHTIFVDL